VSDPRPLPVRTMPAGQPIAARPLAQVLKWSLFVVTWAKFVSRGSPRGRCAASVVRSLGDGTFFTTGIVDLGPSSRIRSIKAADLDNDGDDDVVAIDQANDQVWVLFNSIGINLTGPDDLIIAVGEQPIDLDVGDLNGDGLVDLAVAHRSPRAASGMTGLDVGPGFVTRILNTGNGSFAAPTVLDTGVKLNRGVALADHDGDGDLDGHAIGIACDAEARYVLPDTPSLLPSPLLGAACSTTCGTPPTPLSVPTARFCDADPPVVRNTSVASMIIDSNVPSPAFRSTISWSVPTLGTTRSRSPSRSRSTTADVPGVSPAA